MEFKATLETRHSEKKNSDYKVLIVKLTDTYEKPVFLEPAEIALLELSNKKSEKPPFLK